MKRWAERFFARPEPTTVRSARWVVIDCETSGLDARNDRLLSVGAVRAHAGRIDAGTGFSALVRQDRPSSEANILVHGIGGEAQLGARPARDVLGEFLAFAADAVPVGFHAPFDDEVLTRALRAEGLEPLQAWLDCAAIAPVLYPRAAAAREGRHSLDDWLAEFEIGSPNRHDALADAYATAQLLLVLLHEAERQGVHTVAELRRLGRNGRWLQG